MSRKAEETADLLNPMYVVRDYEGDFWCQAGRLWKCRPFHISEFDDVSSSAPKV